MFSVSPAEIATIAVVALLVFGPKRLPDIARKAGKILRDVRGAANELKTGLEAEYQDTLEPLKDVRDTMKDAISGVDLPNLTPPAAPPPKPAAEATGTAAEDPDGPAPAGATGAAAETADETAAETADDAEDGTP